MKCLIVVAAVLQAALAGHVSVQMPYLNPAGVTYVTGSAPVAAAPLAATHYTAGALAPVSSAYTTSTYYGNGHFLGRSAISPVVAAHHQVAAAPIVHQAVAAHTAAVVPTVHHIPAVADVPVTRYQAQHGFIQKEVDVAKPAVKTSRYELRRPAIQKQFYDIEERVVVRPAGSALVELDQPHSKVHKSSVVSPLAPAHIAPAHISPAVIAASPAPPTFVSPAPPSFIPAGPGFGISSTPSPVDQGYSDDDSIVVEARRISQPQIQLQQQQQLQQHFQQQPQQQFFQQPQQQLFQQPQQQLFRQQPQQFFQPQQQQQLFQQQQQPFFQQQPQQQQEPQQFQQQQQQQLQRTAIAQPALIPEQRSQIQPQQRSQIDTHTQAIVRTRPEDQSANQQRLIDLLTAREGVADVGFGGASFRDIGDAGTVRARVLSAQISPRDAPVTGERVNTRRVVVSRPIETVQEVDVLEPVTKLERVAVQHPALFKTAHVGYERVPTSVPVLGKAIAPLAYAQNPIYYH